MGIEFVVEPGWRGGFTRNQADGAIPNGRVIIKAVMEENDKHPIGARGIVLGSLDGDGLNLVSPTGMPVRYAYFVEWDDLPKHAIGVCDYKIAAAP